MRILLLLVLLSAVLPNLLHAQEDEGTFPPSHDGWMVGVGLFGTYSPHTSAGLDEFYAEHSFPDYGASPFLYSSSLLIGWPRFWFEFDLGRRFISEWEAPDYGTIRSEGIQYGLRVGYPLNEPTSSVRVVPNVALLYSSTEFDARLDPLVGVGGETHRELTAVAFAPSVTLSMYLQQNLSLQLTGGYALQVGTLWRDGTERDIEPAVELESGPDIRLGLFLNVVDALFPRRRG